jgi:hypothetical protein
MLAEPENERPLPKVGLPTLAYVVVVFGALGAYLTFRPSGALLALLIAAPVLALAWMLRTWFRYNRMGGGKSAAQRAYLRRFLPLMLAYAAMLIGAVWLNKTVAPSGALAVALASLPALPLVGVIWAMGRLLVEEKDEYQRSLSVRQFLIATGFMLVVACVWGFLETFGQVPHLPMYWAFIIWCAGLGIGSAVNEMKS